MRAGSAAPASVRRLRLVGAAVCCQAVLRVENGTEDARSLVSTRLSEAPRGIQRAERGVWAARTRHDEVARERLSATARPGTGGARDRRAPPWMGRNASPSRACLLRVGRARHPTAFALGVGGLNKSRSFEPRSPGRAWSDGARARSSRVRRVAYSRRRRVDAGGPDAALAAGARQCPFRVYRTKYLTPSPHLRAAPLRCVKNGQTQKWK